MLDFVIQGVLTALVAWFVFWKGAKGGYNFILYAIGIPLPIMFGFAWYERYPTAFGFVATATIIAVGVWSGWKFIENLINEIRG